MKYKRGKIVLVNFNSWRQKEEVRKIKPAVIISDSVYNYESDLVIVIPLTTNLIDNAGVLRVRIKHRDKLERDSDVMIEQIRCISKNRIIETIGELKKNEIRSIEKGLNLILNLN